MPHGKQKINTMVVTLKRAPKTMPQFYRPLASIQDPAPFLMLKTVLRVFEKDFWAAVSFSVPRFSQAITELLIS